MNTKQIQEFICTNERNLRVAAAVAEAWPEVREQLVLGFFSRLGENVKKTLTGWTFKTYDRFQTDECSGCCLTKPAWRGEYFVDLTCSGFGKRINFGVSRAAEKDHVRKRPHCEKVLTAVKEAFPSATARVWWEAKMTMHSPASDWRKPEVLWRLHTDTKFLDEVADKLVSVAQASEKHLDEFVGKQ